MARRFFVESPIRGETATLAESEAHHLIHVLRAVPGARVTLFDGSGAEFEAAVTSLGRSTVELDIVARHAIDRELSRKIHLAVALPKGDRQKWLVEKCVELGVHALTPLTTERSVSQPTGKALKRLERSVIEASKQCGRNRLMKVEQPMPLAEMVTGGEGPGTERWIAHLTGAPLADALDGVGDSDATVLIGPEGGFSVEEVKLACQHDWHVVSLGTRMLRIETAALMIAARLQ